MIDCLPLPDGWTSEPAGSLLTMIRHPAGYMVTIDWRMRVFRGGLTSIARPASTAKYAGRGWQQRIVADAIAWLESVCQPRAARAGKDRP